MVRVINATPYAASATCTLSGDSTDVPRTNGNMTNNASDGMA